MKLGYGCGHIEIDSEGCQVVLPDELPPAKPEEIIRALDQPFGLSLSDLSDCRSASVLISDSTRPSPSHLILPPLVKRLQDIGVSEVRVIFALGTHRRLTENEERLLLRESIRLPHLQHDKSRCVPVGVTSRGTPVEIFEEAVSSDLIIATGNIEYHYYAGYSGGAKAVLPGISSERSTIKNHELMRDPLAASGRLDSPVRLDLEEAAGIAGLDFILNVVLNSKKEIVAAAAGDYIKAHRVGARLIDRMYRKKVRPAQIVVTCAGGRPKDINLFQAQKALDNAKNAAVPGGTIILLAECSEGLGHPVFERWVREASSREDCIERFGREYEFGGHKAALLASESLNHDLILVSSLPDELSSMCFFRPAKSLEQALEMAENRQGRDARTIVMPHGDLTLAVKD